MVTAIVLCAGESRRFGSPKALANINNTTAIEQIQQKLLISSVEEIIIVLGCARERVMPFIHPNPRVSTVINHDHARGQFSSLKTGLAACREGAAALVLPVDCPWMRPETIDALINAATVLPRHILVPVYQRRRGHPPLLPNCLFAQILSLPDSASLPLLFGKYPPMEIETDDAGILKTFNTADELKNADG